MPTYGITNSGFVLKRLSDIINEMVIALNSVTDPVSGESLTPDLTDENDPLVQIVNSFCDSVSVMWEQLQLTYNQFDPLKATGAGLSGLVQLNNLRRTLGVKATGSFNLTGTANKTVLAGLQVSDINGTDIFILPEFTFDAYGAVTVTGECSVKGSVTALAGTLVKILTPISGVLSVTNPSDITGGSSDETDAALRARQQLSTAGTARSVIDSIYSALAGAADVTHVRVYQNNGLTTDIRGLPAKSVAVVIVGGSDETISSLMFEKIPLGLETYGTTSTTQTDAQGFIYPILFSRPTEIPIYIDIVLEVVNPFLWETDSDTQIKEAILAWAASGGSSIGVTEGYDPDGYLPGESVYASELYTPINKQPGIRIDSVKVGISAPATDNFVEILWDEMATFDSANIDISFVSESS